MQRFAVALVSVLVVTVLAGCGDDDDAPGGNPDAAATIDGPPPPDAPPPDAAPMPDAPPVMMADANTGTMNDIDGGVGVNCLGTTCQPGQVCCVMMQGGGGSGMCINPGDQCMGGGTVSCDGPEDCMAGDSCCGSFGGGGGGAMCGGQCQITLCHTQADCGGTTACCSSGFGIDYCSPLGMTCPSFP
jgi:hypothetical protein